MEPGCIWSFGCNPKTPGARWEYIERAWSQFFPDFPFAYTFLDEDIDRLYRTETRIGYFFGVFALVAVFLTCLGLFALVSFTVERRTREIGIRKALGASVRRMLAMLSAEFVVLALIANVFAWPAARLIMGRWLEDFRLPGGGRMGHLLRFGRRGPADNIDHHRLSRDPDRVHQSRRGVA